MPENALSPAWGQGVGGVRERPARKAVEQSPGLFADAAVKGTLIVVMPSSFAGRRWSADLGRSVCARNGSLPFRASAPATAGVSWTPRRGTTSAHASQERRTRSKWHLRARSARGHVLRSVQEPVLVDRHCAPSASAVGGDAAVRYRGRANLGNREEPASRSRSSDEARLATRHRSLIERARLVRKKRKGVAASVYARNRELR